MSCGTTAYPALHRRLARAKTVREALELASVLPNGAEVELTEIASDTQRALSVVRGGELQPHPTGQFRGAAYLPFHSGLWGALGSNAADELEIIQNAGAVTLTDEFLFLEATGGAGRSSVRLPGTFARPVYVAVDVRNVNPGADTFEVGARILLSSANTPGAETGFAAGSRWVADNVVARRWLAGASAANLAAFPAPPSTVRNNTVSNIRHRGTICDGLTMGNDWDGGNYQQDRIGLTGVDWSNGAVTMTIEVYAEVTTGVSTSDCEIHGVYVVDSDGLTP